MPTEYCSVPIDGAHAMMKKLAEGKTVQVKKEHFNGKGHELVLSKSKSKRLAKSLESGKGMRLNLSEAERKQNKSKGWWSNVSAVLKPIVKAVKDPALNAVKNVVGKAIDATPLPDSLKGAAKNLANSGIDKGADLALDKAGLSSGFKAGFGAGAKKQKKGKGFLDDLEGAFGLGAKKHERKKRAPTKYNLHIKDYMNKHLEKGGDRQATFKDAVAAWNKKK